MCFNPTNSANGDTFLTLPMNEIIAIYYYYYFFFFFFFVFLQYNRNGRPFWASGTHGRRCSQNRLKLILQGMSDFLFV